MLKIFKSILISNVFLFSFLYGENKFVNTYINDGLNNTSDFLSNDFKPNIQNSTDIDSKYISEYEGFYKISLDGIYLKNKNPISSYNLDSKSPLYYTLENHMNNGGGIYFKSEGKGLILGNGHNKILRFEFDSNNASSILKLDNTDGISLIGDISLDANATSSSLFKANISGNILGKITISGDYVDNTKTNNNFKNIFIFTGDNVNITGQVTTNKGINVFYNNGKVLTFNDNIKYINASYSSLFVSGNENTMIKFNGFDNKLTGFGLDIINNKVSDNLIINLHNNFRKNYISIGVGPTQNSGTNGLFGNNHTFILDEYDSIKIDALSKYANNSKTFSTYNSNNSHKLLLILDKKENRYNKNLDNNINYTCGNGNNQHPNNGCGIISSRKENKINIEKIGTNVVGFELFDYDLKSKDDNVYSIYYIDKIYSKGITESNKRLSGYLLNNNFNLFMNDFSKIDEIQKFKYIHNRHNMNIDFSSGLNKYNFNDNDINLNDRMIYNSLKMMYDYKILETELNKYYISIGLKYLNAKNENKTEKELDNTINGITLKDFHMLKSSLDFSYINKFNQNGEIYNISGISISSITNKSELLQHNKDYMINNIGTELYDRVGFIFYLNKNNIHYLEPENTINIGFLNKSNITQQLGDTYLISKKKSMIIIENKLGLSYGINLDTNDSKSDLKFGIFYIYDYFDNGEIELLSNMRTQSQLNFYNTDSHRILTSINSKFEITKNNLLNINFEKSFYGSIENMINFKIGYRHIF